MGERRAIDRGNRCAGRPRPWVASAPPAGEGDRGSWANEVVSMSWRRGELWLDTDLLWFREGAGAPGARRLRPRSIRFPAPPPRARRLAPAPGGVEAAPLRAAGAGDGARAVAGPCSCRSAALRSGGGHGDAVVAEDPPSLTFRLDHRDDRGRGQAARWAATHGSPGARPAARRPANPARHRRSRERTRSRRSNGITRPRSACRTTAA